MPRYHRKIIHDLIFQVSPNLPFLNVLTLLPPLSPMRKDVG